jgi:hypothetical protein
VLTGIKFTSGTGKLFGVDVTLEGDGALNLVPQLAPLAGTGTQPAQVAQD